MSLQPIYDVVQICVQHGITNAVVCPGSRCAPLTLSFARHEAITVRTISDERSAAFIALGIAQQTKSTVALVCTSGSAAYNFAPAIAEAFFQQIPLLVFTADRPAEWIDQLDGQTIRQQNIFGDHVKKSYQLLADRDSASLWYLNRVVNESAILASEFPAGPVHLNIPFREPFYPLPSENASFDQDIRVVRHSNAITSLPKENESAITNRLASFSKILVLGGQQDFDEGLSKTLDRFIKNNKCVVVGDVISNLHTSQHTIKYADAFLGQCGSSVKESLRPELLITFGKSVLSKTIKQFLRSHPPKEHWHIQPAGTVADTFMNLTEIIRVSPTEFFKTFSSAGSVEPFDAQKKENYCSFWKAEEHRNRHSIATFFNDSAFGELYLIKKVLEQLPARCNLHLANSMTVRYVNLLGIDASKKGVHVFCNRGTSGIDGSTSTALGHALSSDVPNILITGDMAFFYDRNAFWNNYRLRNFHVLVINNHGGVIFNLIDGPSTQPELAEYFITNQKLSAEPLAREFGFEYQKIDSDKKVKNALADFFTFEGKTKITELECSQDVGKAQFEKFKLQIKKGYEA